MFVSCGTGTTLTGICAGMQEYFPKAKIHAISVSRTYDIEHITLKEDMRMLNEYLGKNYSFDNMTFYEDYLCGGYDQTTPDLLNCVQECVAKEGMIIDPCYTGKSFYGMNDIIKKNLEQYKDKNVLYWNSGGIMNLLSMRRVYGL